MTHDNLTYDDLLRIVELIKSSEQFSEFRLKIGEIEVELRRRDASTAASAPPAPAAPAASTPIAGAQAASPSKRSEPAATPVAGHAMPPVQWPEHFIVIRSPMVGTFYRAPEPGAPPFVQIGDNVGPDSVICIIEVMKLMNSIPAGANGTVRHILVHDAQAVEAQQPLIVIEPTR